ncbi:MAG: GSCFA domain-containing protein [Spirochaetales bacterium]|nr:GSCFA domain-containing protein [Spirochaetales bacterium]
MISHLYKSTENFFNENITSVRFASPDWKLEGGKLFFMGSCFAENLYKTMTDLKLDTQISPFGNIYNPESILEAVKLISGKNKIDASDIFENNAKFYHFMFHTQKTSDSREKLFAEINSELEAARSFLKSAEAVVITLGTSFVYKLDKDISPAYKKGSIVNNCHKLPSKDFARESLSVDTATKALEDAIKELLSINQNLKIIISLSPVRHLRDNATENSLSKATLRCSIENVVRNNKSWYFPSYEIVLDELRDYRWYAEDLCHPNQKAVDYIISRFISSVYSKNFTEFLGEWLKIITDLNHRPINPESEGYKSFIDKTLQKQDTLLKKYPEIDLRIQALQK